MLLEVKNLSVSYGGIQAVRHIDLTVAEAQRVTIIGANGAGKSSTLKAIAGLVKYQGRILFRGQEIDAMAAYQRVTKGLCLVPEGRGIFQRMSIEENLWMGAYSQSQSSQFTDQLQRVYDIFPRLYERRGQNAGTLSGGEQQMLAIGRALLAQPQLLMLDEPSMGLAPQMVDHLFEVISKVVDHGVSLLLIEQNAQLALSLCDRAYVMETGEIILADDAKACLHHPLVQQAYLG